MNDFNSIPQSSQYPQSHNIQSPGMLAYSAPFGHDAGIAIYPQWRATVTAAPFQAHALPHAPLSNSGQAVIRHMSGARIPLTFKEGKVTFEFSDSPRINLHDFHVNAPADTYISEILNDQSVIRPSSALESLLLVEVLGALSHAKINAQWREEVSSWDFAANAYLPSGHDAHPLSQPNVYSVNLFIDKQRNAHACKIHSLAANLPTVYFFNHSINPGAMTHPMSVAASAAQVDNDMMG